MNHDPFKHSLLRGAARYLIGAVVLGLMTSAALAQGRRVALVVGVANYSAAPGLGTVRNDADAMADLFRKAGFDVVTARSDVSNLEFKRAILDFEDSVADAEIAVVFYAGHGIQVRETNYLIPADAKLLNERDIEDEAISLDRLITAVEGAKRLRLIILDACRDNPFPNKMKRRGASRAALAPGLGLVETPVRNILIAFAALGTSARCDGPGKGNGKHSPYTSALLKHLTTPDLDLRLALERVHQEAVLATGGKLEPVVFGGLDGEPASLAPQDGPEASPRSSRPEVRHEPPPGLHLPLDMRGWGRFDLKL